MSPKDTPLLHAIDFRKFDEARRLVEAGADVNRRGGSWNWTPLFCAINSNAAGAWEFVEYLIAKGADVNAQEYDGDTPLALAAARGRLETVRLLVKAGANLEARDRDGNTALARAAAHREDQVVEELLRHGAQVDGTNALGWTPLMQAAYQGGDAAMAVLLNHGAAIHAVAQELGRTPLMVAAASGSRKAVQVLLDRGANPMRRDRLGLAAHDYAFLDGYAELAAMLPAVDERMPYWTRLVRDPKVPLEHCLLCRGIPEWVSVKVDGWDRDYRSYFFRLLNPLLELSEEHSDYKEYTRHALYQCPICHSMYSREVILDMDNVSASWTLQFKRTSVNVARKFLTDNGRPDLAAGLPSDPVPQSGKRKTPPRAPPRKRKTRHRSR